jgi:hypothetical protein
MVKVFLIRYTSHVYIHHSLSPASETPHRVSSSWLLRELAYMTRYQRDVVLFQSLISLPPFGDICVRRRLLKELHLLLKSFLFWRTCDMHSGWFYRLASNTSACFCISEMFIPSLAHDMTQRLSPLGKISSLCLPICSWNSVFSAVAVFGRAVNFWFEILSWGEGAKQSLQVLSFHLESFHDYPVEFEMISSSFYLQPAVGKLSLLVTGSAAGE